MRRKLGVLYPDEDFFKLHSWATERKKTGVNERKAQWAF